MQTNRKILFCNRCLPFKTNRKTHLQNSQESKFSTIQKLELFFQNCWAVVEIYSHSNDKQMIFDNFFAIHFEAVNKVKLGNCFFFLNLKNRRMKET